MSKVFDPESGEIDYLFRLIGNCDKDGYLNEHDITTLLNSSDSGFSSKQINYSEPSTFMQTGNTTVFMLAFMRGKIKIAAALLIHEHNDIIDINATIDGGYTPLSYACALPWSHAAGAPLAWLCKQPKLEIGKPDADGRIPLVEAAGVGHEEAVKLLLEHGANINKKDKTGNAALTSAYSQNRTNSKKRNSIIKQLLDHPDANLNLASAYCQGYNFTLLMHAAYNGDLDLVQKLLTKPTINVNYQCGLSGLSALHVAYIMGYPGVVNALLEGPEIKISFIADCIAHDLTESELNNDTENENSSRIKEGQKACKKLLEDYIAKQSSTCATPHTLLFRPENKKTDATILSRNTASGALYSFTTLTALTGVAMLGAGALLTFGLGQATVGPLVIMMGTSLILFSALLVISAKLFTCCFPTESSQPTLQTTAYSC